MRWHPGVSPPSIPLARLLSSSVCRHGVEDRHGQPPTSTQDGQSFFAGLVTSEMAIRASGNLWFAVLLAVVTAASAWVAQSAPGDLLTAPERPFQGYGTPAVRTGLNRIVSTSPSITETLFALGLGDRVVGVSTYCRYPAAVAAAAEDRHVPTSGCRADRAPAADLVIVHAGPHDAPRQLAVLGIPVGRRRSRHAAGASTRRFGRLARAAGVGDRAERARRRICRAVSTRVRAAVAGRPSKKVLMIVGRRPGTLTDLVAVGRDSYLNDLVDHRRRRERAGRSRAPGLSAHLDGDGDPTRAGRHRRCRRHGRHS